MYPGKMKMKFWIYEIHKKQRGFFKIHIEDNDKVPREMPALLGFAIEMSSKYIEAFSLLTNMIVTSNSDPFRYIFRFIL